MNQKLPRVNFQTIELASRLKGGYLQFPRISRFIPDSAAFNISISIAKIFMLSLISVFLVYVTVKQARILQRNREYLNKIVIRRESVEKELVFWKKISSKYNNYTDVNLKIAELEYRLGNFQTSNVFIEKALALNPDMKEARVLGEQTRR